MLLLHLSRDAPTEQTRLAQRTRAVRLLLLLLFRIFTRLLILHVLLLLLHSSQLGAFVLGLFLDRSETGGGAIVARSTVPYEKDVKRVFVLVWDPSVQVVEGLIASSLVRYPAERTTQSVHMRVDGHRVLRADAEHEDTRRDLGSDALERDQLLHDFGIRRVVQVIEREDAMSFLGLPQKILNIAAFDVRQAPTAQSVDDVLVRRIEDGLPVVLAEAFDKGSMGGSGITIRCVGAEDGADRSVEDVGHIATAATALPLLLLALDLILPLDILGQAISPTAPTTLGARMTMKFAEDPGDSLGLLCCGEGPVWEGRLAEGGSEGCEFALGEGGG